MTTKTPDADVLKIDLQDLTLDEIDLVEEVIDGPLDSLGKEGVRKAPFLRALALVVKHRENPEEYPCEPAEARAASLKKVGRLKVSLDEAPPNPPAPSGQ